jgi:hypothetical protein
MVMTWYFLPTFWSAYGMILLGCHKIDGAALLFRGIKMRRKYNMTDAEMKAWLETQYDLNENGCWVWKGGMHTYGYGQVKWQGTTNQVYRLYWLLSGRTIPEGLEMCHGHNCSRACYNPEHLKPGTHAENMGDKVRDGTNITPKGEKHGRAKLTENQVLVIRANVENKTQRELAKEYGVDQALISAIINRKRWAHLT